jgi:hypothetical protein
MCCCSRWGFFWARPPFRRSSPFLIWYASHNKKGFENLMFPLWFAFLGGFFGHGSFHFVLCILPLLFLSALIYLWLTRLHHHLLRLSSPSLWYLTILTTLNICFISIYEPWMSKVISKKPIKREYLFFLVLSMKWKDKMHLWKIPQIKKAFSFFGILNKE